MHFEQVLVTEDGTTFAVKKEVTTKVVVKTKEGFCEKNKDLCVVEDTGNGYIACFPGFTSTQQDHYVCLDYAQADYLLNALAELFGKQVVSKDEVPVKAGQEEILSTVASDDGKDDESWIEHDGCGQLVADNAVVDVKFRDGGIFKGFMAGVLYWGRLSESDDDIVAWRYAK
jgi:hypothetical protein